MIKNRPLGHIGFPTKDIEATVNWYIDVLGFSLIGSFETEDGIPVRFIKNGDVVYEIYEVADIDAPGKLDHICFQSEDIEADYKYCQEQGYTFEAEGIQSLPTVWEKGVRFFKIMSPSGEPVEFCQIL